MDSPHEGRRLSSATALKTAALVVCVLVVLRHAWLSDDAFITLRTVRNLAEGEGLRWNLHERVQGFTHPLWMFLLAFTYSLTHEPMAAGLLPALVLCATTLYLVAFRLGLSAPAALLALAAVISSKSFVDYSTSGLENPLTNLLFVLLVVEHLRPQDAANGDLEAESRRRAFRVTLLAGLLALNRLDTALVSLPFLASAYWRLHDTFRGAGKTLLVGLAPILLWEIFAVVYYGFPLPNTAYAKLGAGIPASALWLQGLGYFLSQIAFDPTSLLVILCALVFLLLRRERQLYPLGFGIIMYLVYVVRIGGDFMAGRYFALPVLAGALLLTFLLRQQLATKGATAYLPAAIMVVGGLLLTLHPTLSANVDYRLAIHADSKAPWDERGVSDERAFYVGNSALLRWRRGAGIPDDERRSQGRSIAANQVAGTGSPLGLLGFAAPPAAIILDGNGLTDALIARLPALDRQNWRIGHFWRDLPAGYGESISRDRNLITDPNIARLYDRVKLVVSGPIWSWERWKEILRMNLGLAAPAPAMSGEPSRGLSHRIRED